MGIQDTPQASRLQIGLYGQRNAGKSSLINALTGQKVSLVSNVAGTTTDPVFKSMELHGFGPVTFIDTAGLDDEGPLGQLRMERTRDAALKTDVAVFVFTSTPTCEGKWIQFFRDRRVPILAVINKIDVLSNVQSIQEAIRGQFGLDALELSACTGENIDTLRSAIIRLAPDNFWDLSITGDLAGESDLVLLVMPQDLEAPKGRLILPQVQTIRELLDKKCSVVSCTADKLEKTLSYLAKPPKLIITDSQVFAQVYAQKPQESLLTSFSILFASYKGDIHAFLEGAKALECLNNRSHILIAEACSHAPLEEDIGRVKIPRMLRKKYGESLQIDFVRGNDFPQDLSCYDLIVHCGACMFSRRYVLNRIEAAQRQGVPICNYGIVIAALTGILDKVCHP